MPRMTAFSSGFRLRHTHGLDMDPLFLEEDRHSRKDSFSGRPSTHTFRPYEILLTCCKSYAKIYPMCCARSCDPSL
ncbi:uncharacterized protein Dyak_GE28083 [Drosophila yakuba]|uniref:Uncharacterized protein n=1 Tax=Drosophila yakuba TaxID=7245 RepID=A0A0R1E9A0_DROYA|nr:uncharacterized protein Dyak_GE28083 [Drosophila yakuba]